MRINEMEDRELDMKCIHCGHDGLVFSKPKLNGRDLMSGYNPEYYIFLECKGCGMKTTSGVHAPGQRDGEIPNAQQRELIDRFNRGDVK